jgi:hypothetical protein
MTHRAFDIRAKGQFHINRIDNADLKWVELTSCLISMSSRMVVECMSVKVTTLR